MVRSALSKVAWVGRTTSMVFGLALVMALVLGVASMAFGANGQAWILGKSNVATAVTRLGGTLGVNGPMLRLINNNADANDTALDLRVQEGEAPMRVNSNTRVANLNAATAGRADSAAQADTATNAQNATNATNADKLDDNDSTAFQKRVSGECAVGSSIRTIDANGVVTCEQDDSDASGVAGGDLTGNYPNPQIANGAVAGGLGGEIADNTVNSDDVTSNSLRQDDIATGGVGSGEVADGTLEVADIARVYTRALVSFGTLSADQCTVAIAEVEGAQDNDIPIVVSQDATNITLVAYEVQTAGQVRVKACNTGNSTITGSLQPHFIILRPF